MEDFDFIVIGAGIAGASVAARLAETHRVVMLEREEFPGYHSTGRSAAIFSEIYGNASVRALSRASRSFFHAPPVGFTETPLIRPRGAMHIAHAGQMAALDEFLASEDVRAGVRDLTKAEALAVCPILKPDAVHAAAIEDDAADVDVHALHQGFLRLCKARGGQLVTHADVRALFRANGRWTVECGTESYRAPVVVNAAGAWADTVAGLAGVEPLGIQPCRRTAALVELPDGLASADWPLVLDIEELFYFKPDAGLLLISPTDETPVEPCDVQPEELDVAIAVDRVEQATTLGIRRIRKRWAGLRSFAPDRTLVIGFEPSAEGFFWLAGQGGYGMQTAPAASAIAAALARGIATANDIDVAIGDLSPARFR